MAAPEQGAGTASSWPRFANLAEYRSALTDQQEVFKARWLWGQHLEAACAGTGSYPGYCGVCGRATEFSFTAGSGGPVNLREEMACSQCALNARIRVVLHLLSRNAPPGNTARIYLTEQTTLLYKFVRAHWPNVTGSEYFGEDMRPRLVQYLKHLVGQREALRHQDVTALTFSDESLDVIVSCDVLEHVPDYRAALAEFARVLVRGGRLLLTVPFMEQSADTTVRARLRDDGSIEHLEEPEYHGDPVDPNGVLAFYNFGWDLLEEVRKAGFRDARWCLPWAPAEGLFLGLWALEARR
ncbi:MAG: class I SAM-dependent methyltransferase [Wenzhouxiangella sp.]|nr:MAG: class I SAM-dependent methyltransferase [Wenzhouxiangella sp.]